MKRIALLLAVFIGAIGVRYLLIRSKSPTAVVMSQSEPPKVKTGKTSVTKKNNQPTGDLFVTGSIEAIGFADSYVPQPDDLNSGGHVAAGNQPGTNINPALSDSTK